MFKNTSCLLLSVKSLFNPFIMVLLILISQNEEASLKIFSKPFKVFLLKLKRDKREVISPKKFLKFLGIQKLLSIVSKVQRIIYYFRFKQNWPICKKISGNFGFMSHCAGGAKTSHQVNKEFESKPKGSRRIGLQCIQVSWVVQFQVWEHLLLPCSY